MTVALAPLVRFRGYDNNNVPLVGGKLFTYAAGTTTKQATYTDSTGGTQNTNPIILDSRGEADLWFDPSLSYKLVLSPSTDTDPPANSFWTRDNIISLGSFKQNGTGAFARSYQNKLTEFVSVLDFGADPTGVNDSTSAWNNAATTGGLVTVPKGSYLLNSSPSLGTAVFRYDKGVTLSGAGVPGTWALSGTAATQFVQTSAPSGDVATEAIRREANYSGGTPGDTPVALHVQTDVSSGVTNYEWNGLFELNNAATAGQNTALYAQANKNSTGPTWAFVSQANDSTGTNSGGLIGHEIDVIANGTDSANSRVGIDIVGGRYGGTGALAEIGFGIRISPQAFNTANAKFKTGFQGNGLFNTGIDFASSATISGNFIQGPGFSVNGTGTVISLTPLTVATLPAAGTAGRRSFVTDATATTFATVVAGSGSNKVPVYDDGAAWRIG